RPLAHVHEAVAITRMLSVEPLTVILNRESKPASLGRKLYTGLCAIGMADDVVDRLLEDQEDLASHIRPHLQAPLPLRSAESKLDAARGEHVAGESPHALREVAQLVALGVDDPNDVAH